MTGESLTLGGWLDRWAARLRSPPYSPTTVENYQYRVSLVPEWARQIPLERFDPMAMEQVRDELLATHSPRTVMDVRATVRRALGQAVKARRISINAAALIDPPRDDRGETIEPLTLGEARALLDALAGHRLESLYTVTVAVGLREGEAVGLRWPKVDLDAGMLRVDWQRTRTRTHRPVERPSKRGSIRTVALPAFCVDALREHRRHQAAERLLVGDAWHDHDLVWPSQVGTPLTGANLLRQLKRTCRRAGIREISFHTLRHSAATLMLAQGVPERVIMDTLGHSTTAMMVRYTQVIEELKRDAADAMDTALRRRAR